jgi:hypothetical protein
MTRIRTAIAAGALLLAIGAAPGFAAAQAANNPAWRAACRRDALTLCRLQAIRYDVPGVRDCLIRNLEKVSQPCQGVIKAARSQHNPPPQSPARR